ncbi:glycosyltransferase family 4 protein [Rhodanobacter sp. B2A1Ga4]|uniref:glycosyltransferase family 4 protein n=1 Tax=Rhodanobacter sp. B2A1Ga4 TaxID=2778647 RepID=UPI001B36E852|nr:glycosyltransferase family 4 protein [Rhodanobacter sp. B2A1Ga4]MBQ4854712.1 glycosyltransferase family 4 protein [Rhodanobacter sp. B2A1Ga4]
MTASNDATRPRRICVVGPVLPFRGGISHYNSMLFRALKESDVQVSLFSFSRQYPKLLYPGANDRDPSLKGYREPGAQYTIDSINPFTWWKTARSIIRERPDMVVFHWWTVFWAPCFAFMASLLKRHDIRIAIICHNLVDHDSGVLKATISRWVLDMADAYLVHSSEHKNMLLMARPGISVAQHPIPVYGHYPQAGQMLAKRGRLELLFFGFIRPYKGLDILLEAMHQLDDTAIHLTVIGEHWGDPSALLEQLSTFPNVEAHLRYMSDGEAADYFERTDFVVLPYRTATGSAVASVAFHYNKPIIASRTGGLPDVVIDGVTGKLVAPNNPKELADTVRQLDRAQAQRFSDGVRNFKTINDWRSLCDSLLSLEKIHLSEPQLPA